MAPAVTPERISDGHGLEELGHRDGTVDGHGAIGIAQSDLHERAFRVGLWAAARTRPRHGDDTDRWVPPMGPGGLPPTPDGTLLVRCGHPSQETACRP